MAEVHFVGAGPGDKELITLKGYQLLKRGGCRYLCRVARKPGVARIL